MKLEELLEKCPTLNYSKSNDSKRKLPTRTIVEDLIKMGWTVIDHYTGYSINNNMKHGIIFNIPLPSLMVKDIENSISAQVVLVGDNGVTPFRFYVCFFNSHTNNRIFIPIKYSKNLTIKNFYISFRASNYSIESLIDNVITLLIGVVEGSKKILEYAQKKPKNLDIKNFTAQAFLRRKEIKNGDIVKHSKAIPKNTLTTILQNDLDSINSIWELFNVVHDKIIKGFEAYPTVSSKRPFKYKSITSLDKLIKININLYLDIFKIAK